MAKSFQIDIVNLPSWTKGTIGTCGTIGTVACDYLVLDVLGVPCAQKSSETRQVKDINPSLFTLSFKL